jgi:hypothetical protein
MHIEANSELRKNRGVHLDYITSEKLIKNFYVSNFNGKFRRFFKLKVVPKFSNGVTAYRKMEK